MPSFLGITASIIVGGKAVQVRPRLVDQAEHARRK